VASHSYRPARFEQSGPVVRCRAIRKSFGPVSVLVDIDFALDVGRTLALMGPSGSGKSTLLAIIGLLERPSAGVVELFGQPAPSLDRKKAQLRAARMAWVFQRAALMGGRSTLDNVSFSLILNGLGRRDAEARALEYLRRVGLEDRAHVQARRLSGGEQQRIEVARALAREPELILCDEPTASLDRTNADAVIDALLVARHPRTSVLVATHDPRVAGRCDYVAHLVDGRMRP
jgi:putative ABC transport system ATP-binding protein